MNEKTVRKAYDLLSNGRIFGDIMERLGVSRAQVYGLDYAYRNNISPGKVADVIGSLTDTMKALEIEQSIDKVK